MMLIRLLMLTALFAHAAPAEVEGEQDVTLLVQVALQTASEPSKETMEVSTLLRAAPVPGAAADVVRAPAPAIATEVGMGEGHLSLLSARVAENRRSLLILLGVGCIVAFIVGVSFHAVLPDTGATMAVCCGLFYILISAAVIETNKWLMMQHHFPHPVALTMNHMTMSFLCCGILFKICPSAFPSSENIVVDRAFCLKFVPLGAAFALSIVCGTAAYRYLSVSFLQIMKQSNIASIYIFSLIFGLEEFRKCSVLLLIGVILGSWMGVQGEIHFQLTGFLLQVMSCLSDVLKVIIQSILMSGSRKLDPLTMVLFMAPAVILANIIPFIVLEGAHYQELVAHARGVAPVLVLNAFLAFALNLMVATCIKKLSAVGYLLCGVVKDVCIVTSSAWFLGDSLALLQKFGFSIALSGVFAYSMFKQNQDCFEDDEFIVGFMRLVNKLAGGDSIPNSIVNNAEKNPNEAWEASMQPDEEVSTKT